MVYVTAVQMTSGGTHHKHIGSVRWTNPSSGKTGDSSRAEMVKWITGGGIARVRDSAGDDISVGVVKEDPPYIRTHADGVWTDNLLALPRY